MAVEMESVSSSAITAIGYDEKAKEMHVRFKTGGVHIFDNVKEATYNALLNADSVGQYFHAHISGKFSSRPK